MKVDVVVEIEGYNPTRMSLDYGWGDDGGLTENDLYLFGEYVSNTIRNTIGVLPDA